MLSVSKENVIAGKVTGKTTRAEYVVSQGNYIIDFYKRFASNLIGTVKP